MAIPNLSSFDAWWESDGKFYDPDWSDVPWYDKRKSLAEYAWHRALAAAPSREPEPKYNSMKFALSTIAGHSSDERAVAIAVEALHGIPVEPEEKYAPSREWIKRALREIRIRIHNLSGKGQACNSPENKANSDWLDRVVEEDFKVIARHAAQQEQK